MDREYYVNSFSDQVSNNIEDDINQIIPTYIQIFKASLAPGDAWTINSSGKRIDGDRTIYTGFGGHLYLFWKLRSAYPSYENDLRTCVEAVKKKYNELDTEIPTFLIGKIGISALLAVIEKNPEYVEDVLSNTPDNWEAFELLYGAAGGLYALGFILKHYPEVPQRPQIIAKIQAIANCTVSNKNQNNHLIFHFPPPGGKLYLGAAHGTIGILHILMQLREYIPQHDQVIKDSINLVINSQFPSGNFPSYPGNKNDDTVHFCHGAPGAVPMLCLAYQIYNESSYLQAALRAGEDVWRRGLLLKGNCLCHGTSGNAYSFLALFNAAGDQIWLNRALRFAYVMGFHDDYNANVLNYDDGQRDRVGIADHPYSLMEGVAGSICFLIDVLSPLTAAFPAYDF